MAKLISSRRKKARTSFLVCKSHVMKYKRCIFCTGSIAGCSVKGWHVSGTRTSRDSGSSVLEAHNSISSRAVMETSWSLSLWCIWTMWRISQPLQISQNTNQVRSEIFLTIRCNKTCCSEMGHGWSRSVLLAWHSKWTAWRIIMNNETCKLSHWKSIPVAERSKARVCGFESRRGHGCLSLVNVVWLFCHVCSVSIPDLEDSYRLWCV